MRDGVGGTNDPAFEAHAAPFKLWAQACWYQWFRREQLQQAADEASCKLAAAKGSWWSVVAGPSAALLASLRRLGLDLAVCVRGHR